MTLAESLEAAAHEDDAVAVRELLRDLPESERMPLQPVARALVAREIRGGIDRVGHLGPTLLAAYGTLPVSELRKLGWRSLHIPGHLEDVLRRRSPERLVPIVEHLLDDVGGRAWSPVRMLVREGVLPAPDRDSYTVALLAASRHGNPAEELDADPGLLDDEVWRLFEVEGGGEDSLASHAKYTGDKWGDLFRDLASRDPALRCRLLDASLAALGRDFATFRAGWFSRFHESLTPTDDERAERVGAYLGLLRSRSAPTVSFAVSALDRVSRAGRLPSYELLGNVEVVLVDTPAGTAKAALDLVARTGKEHGQARWAAIVASTALAHDSVDIQRAALRLIGDLMSTSDPAVAHSVAKRLPEMAASQRAGAQALLERLGGEAGGSAAISAAPHVTATPTVAARPSPLEPARTIRPLTSIDELIDVAISVVETGEPADDVERVLDGVGRLAPERPEGFARLTAALARRCRTILARRESAPFSGFDARADVAAVLLAWATGEVPSVTHRYRGADPGAGAFLSARAHEVAEAASRGAPFEAVCSPTHAGGTIDPAVLVERLSGRSPASHVDLVAAILRLAPASRAGALQAAGRLAGEVGDVVRYALGGGSAIGPTAAWWIAAARVRAPGVDDELVEARHPRLGPDAGRAARVAIVEPKRGMTTARLVLEAEPAPSGDTPADLPTVLMLRGTSSFAWTGRSEPAMLRWMATIQPGYREAWAAKGSAAIASNVDWWSAEWANRVYLEPFVDPLTELGAQARRLVGIALGAREAGERGLATDIVRLALADGRLSAAGLTEGLTSASALGCDRPNRWAGSLGAVAAATPAHAAAVAEAVGASLPSLAVRPRASLVPLLRLLDELLAESGQAVAPEGAQALAALATTGGTAGRLARSVLARGLVPSA